MQGRNEPSFFPTKNNPAPAGEEEGTNETRREGLPDVFLQGQTLRSGEGIKPATGRTGAGEKIDGTVIGAVWWQGDGAVLAEDLAQVMVNRLEG